MAQPGVGGLAGAEQNPGCGSRSLQAWPRHMFQPGHKSWARKTGLGVCFIVFLLLKNSDMWNTDNLVPYEASSGSRI